MFIVLQLFYTIEVPVLRPRYGCFLIIITVWSGWSVKGLNTVKLRS